MKISGRLGVIPILVTAAIVSSSTVTFADENADRQGRRPGRQTPAVRETPFEHEPPILSPPSVPLGPMMTSRNFPRRLPQYSVEEKPKAKDNSN